MKHSIIIALLCIAMGSVANAANVYQINGSGTGGSTFDWANGATWSDGQSATTATNPLASSNDYYIGRDENLAPLPPNQNTAGTPPVPVVHLRAVNNGIFGGRTLNVSNPQFLSIRTPTSPTSATITVPDLRLTSGTISLHNSTGGPAFFYGKITLGVPSSSNALNAGSSGTPTIFRIIHYEAQITGSCNVLNLNMLVGFSDTISFNNPNNNFTVNTVTQTGGIFQINGSGSAGNIGRLNSAGIIRPTAVTDMPNTTVTLTAATGIIDVAFDMQVGDLIVDTTQVADGLYTAAQLNSQFPGRFTGAANLRVGPAGPPPPNAIRNWTNY